MTKSYYSIEGEVYSESANGVRTDYIRDALGSITGTCDSASGVIQNTYRYKPYGGVLAKTGVASDPQLRYAGTVGYRDTQLTHSGTYVRARHYSHEEGLWTTIDPGNLPIPINHYPYSYVNGNPINRIDPTGHNWDDCPEELKKKLRDDWLRMKKAVKRLCPDPNNPPQAVIDCWKNCGDGNPGRSAGCMCKHGSDVPGFGIAFRCKSGAACQPRKINPFSECDGACMCTEAGTFRSNCKTTICLENCTATQMQYLADAYFHELLHCCNSRHKYDSSGNDVNDQHGVPGHGGPGANTLCLLNCLRPLLGLRQEEPWVKPPVIMACRPMQQLHETNR